MAKIRLDQELVRRGLVASRSQAESYIRLGKVLVNGRNIIKSGFFVSRNSEIELLQDEQFVSRAALKLKSAVEKMSLNFHEKIVLDIGSSTGGFTEFALTRGAKKVIAVDVGTNQLHSKLRSGKFANKIELHEKTDVRDFITQENIDIILADVSFIPLREILPYVAKNLASKDTQIVAMLKPQFETGSRLKNAGVIKNDAERRKIIKDFEQWAKQHFLTQCKTDSEVKGSSGNQERFYVLKRLNKFRK